VKIRTAHVVAMTAVLLALVIAACGGVSGPAAGQRPGSSCDQQGYADVALWPGSTADEGINEQGSYVRSRVDRGGLDKGRRADFASGERDLAAVIPLGLGIVVMRRVDTAAFAANGNKAAVRECRTRRQRLQFPASLQAGHPSRPGTLQVRIIPGTYPFSGPEEAQ
jgi:hypothetical protein